MILRISSGEYPWQNIAPTIAPAEVPDTLVGKIPDSVSAFSTPKWEIPRTPPPEKAIPIFDLDFIKSECLI